MTKMNHIEGYVVAHRWFADGEGWSYHPELSSSIKELSEALQPELQNRSRLSFETWESFRVSTRLGDLRGIHKGDADCPDLCAQGRYPTLLMAVLVPEGRVLPEQWQNTLEGLVPEKRGPNETLMMPGVNLTPESKSPGRKITLAGGIIMTCLIIAGIIVLPIFRGDKWESRKMELVSVVEQSMAETQGLPADWTELKTSEKFRRFFDGLGRIEAIDASAGHPDYHYLKFLNELARQTRDKAQGPAWRHYVATLNAFSNAVGLDAELSMHAEGREASAFFAKCMEKLCYLHWFSLQRSTDKIFRTGACTGEQTSSEDARNTALQFISATPPEWEREVALPMLKLLEKWRVREVQPADVPERPWFVIEMFFAFLAAERFPELHETPGAVTTPQGYPSPYEAFAGRLPKTNLLKDMAYPGVVKGDVEACLTVLLRNLSGNVYLSGQDFRSALRGIDEEMNYHQWLVGERTHLSTERSQARTSDLERFAELTDQLELWEQSTASDDDALNAFVARFEGEQTNDRSQH